MVPLHQLAMPVALMGSAVIILRRGYWREFPAFLAYTAIAALFAGMTIGDQPYPIWIIVVAAALLPLLVRECLICSRIHIADRTLFEWTAVVVSVSAALACIPHGLSLTARFNLGRSHFQMACLGAMVAATIYRRRHPVLESRRHVAYRHGLATWLAIKAPASTFVRGGLGFMFFPNTPAKLVQSVCYWLVMAAILGTAMAMTWNVVRRKRAAKSLRVERRVVEFPERLSA